MNFYDIISETNVLVNRYIAKAQEALPENLGLDCRAGYRLFVTEELIAVPKDDDRSLQYYGGFEYVDKYYRIEIGEWVFYSAGDDRVAKHLSRFFEKKMLDQ